MQKVAVLTILRIKPHHPVKFCLPDPISVNSSKMHEKFDFCKEFTETKNGSNFFPKMSRKISEKFRSDFFLDTELNEMKIPVRDLLRELLRTPSEKVIFGCFAAGKKIS